MYCSALLFHKDITFSLILKYWLANLAVIFVLILFSIFHLFRHVVKIDYNLKQAYPLIMIDLLLLYAVSIPDSFIRFFDRFLAHNFIGDVFLGQYAFNLMLVTMVYALFIRPVNSVLVTQISKAHGVLEDYVPIFMRYYLYGLAVYFILFCGYIFLSDQIFILCGLSKYLGTSYLFYVCFINAILYFIALPFSSLITLNDSGRKRLTYCICCIALFNTPLLLLYIHPTKGYFCAGFMLAYVFNVILCIIFEHRVASVFFSIMMRNIMGIIRYPYLKLQNILY